MLLQDSMALNWQNLWVLTSVWQSSLVFHWVLTKERCPVTISIDASGDLGITVPFSEVAFGHGTRM